ncbi:tetratricopeptide repeat protein [Aeromonas enteropelogenes]|uniref:tetratricopeptide repeat protein n=1 Tax=Aeromonas enteropelogenes TaxID=29489 RepID=UPI0038CFBD0E
MLRVKKLSILVLSMLFAASFANAAADQVATADELYQQAVIPWEQGRSSGWKLMLKAADAGSIDAQCWIAKSSMKSIWVWSETTYKYFKMAAGQDGLCGMLALSTKSEGGVAIMGNGGLSNEEKDELRAKLINRSKALADNGNIDGIKMYAFLQAIKDGNDEGYCKWMEKAAKLGDADAMNQLAGSIQDGCGWYILPGSRDKAVRYWIEQAANNGNPRAMDQLAVYFQEAGDIESMLHWYGMGAKIGNVNSILFYSGYLSSAPELGVDVPLELQDKVKAYGLLNAVVSQTIEDDNVFSAYHQAIERMRFLEKVLTAGELDEAKKWSNEWMKTHQVRNYSLEFN